jgi:hypothetical protein
MKTGVRLLTVGIGGLCILFGLGCLNYTKMGSVERHTEVARERGWPEPSRTIVHMGMFFAPLGGGLVGYAAGRGTARAGPGGPQ